jgi:GNAT superfamily N-acetyltransferase
VIWSREDCQLDTDRERLDMDRISAWIRASYWAIGRSHDQVLRSWRGSAVPFGLYGPEGMAGCARVVSDLVTTAYLADVFISDEYRGQGLGLWMMESIMSHPDLTTVRWLLHTRDAHELYRKVGFTDPGPRVMERHRQ